jgi:uncharacterized membrane protein YbhN (UPF0104 family)
VETPLTTVARNAPRWRPYLWHGVGLAFFMLVGWLVADYVKAIDWADVRRALSGYSPWTLLAAAGLVALSHLTYASYDLLGRAYAGHELPARRVLGVTFISYAFNLNLGSLVGGFGFRLRLYHRLGLRASQIGSVIALSLATNWSGWLLLTGAFFAAGQVPLPESYTRTALGLEALGILMIASALLYLALCFGSPRRRWRWRAYTFRLPSGRMALAQVALSSFNWLLIGTIVWLLMPHELGYTAVVSTQLSAAMLAVPTHIPGGLGVLEAIFVATFGGASVPGELIAALLAYRALYYLVPLAVAAVLYFAVEAGVRARGKRARSLV